METLGLLMRRACLTKNYERKACLRKPCFGKCVFCGRLVVKTCLRKRVWGRTRNAIRAHASFSEAPHLRSSLANIPRYGCMRRNFRSSYCEKVNISPQTLTPKVYTRLFAQPDQDISALLVLKQIPGTKVLLHKQEQKQSIR